MNKSIESSKFARQVRAMYLLFFAPNAICLLGSLYFGILHEFGFAVLFLCMALMLFPPMWMLFSQSKKICEQAIEEFASAHSDASCSKRLAAQQVRQCETAHGPQD